MADKKPNAARVKKLQPLIDEVQKTYFAASDAQQAHQLAQRRLKEAVGEGHVFTQISCRANKIGGHIYDNDHAYSGVGHRNCILCGIDDCDF